MQINEISSNWNQSIAALPDSHLLQTKQWAQLKSQFGWQADSRIWGDPSKPDAATLILCRSIPSAYARGVLTRHWCSAGNYSGNTEKKLTPMSWKGRPGPAPRQD